MKTAASASGNEAAFLQHLPERTDQSEMSHLAPLPEGRDHNNLRCSPVISILTPKNPLAYEPAHPGFAAGCC